jgi:integrase/recombinase XerD
MKKGVKYPPEILDRREIEALLAGCGTSPTGRRDRAVLTLLWRSGLRISEALALRPADVNLSMGTLRILTGKGGKARTVGLDTLARSALEAWIAVRPAGRGLGIARSGCHRVAFPVTCFQDSRNTSRTR